MVQSWGCKAGVKENEGGPISFLLHTLYANEIIYAFYSPGQSQPLESSFRKGAERSGLRKGLRMSRLRAGLHHLCGTPSFHYIFPDTTVRRFDPKYTYFWFFHEVSGPEPVVTRLWHLVLSLYGLGKKREEPSTYLVKLIWVVKKTQSFLQGAFKLLPLSNYTKPTFVQL